MKKALVCFCMIFPYVYYVSVKSQIITECERVNVGFLIDSSSSAVRWWAYMKDIVISMIDRLDIPLSYDNKLVGSRVAVVQFATTASTIFDFLSYSDKYTMKAIVSRTAPFNTATATVQGLRLMLDIFNTLSEPRRRLRNIVVLMEDGVSNVDVNDTLPAVDSLREAGIEFFVVEFGSVIQSQNREELIEIAGTSQNYEFIDDYSGVLKVVDRILPTDCSQSAQATTFTPSEKTKIQLTENVFKNLSTNQIIGILVGSIVAAFILGAVIIMSICTAYLKKKSAQSGRNPTLVTTPSTSDSTASTNSTSVSPDTANIESRMNKAGINNAKQLNKVKPIASNQLPTEQYEGLKKVPEEEPVDIYEQIQNHHSDVPPLPLDGKRNSNKKSRRSQKMN